jgi:hypothetical protein
VVNSDLQKCKMIFEFICNSTKTGKKFGNMTTDTIAAIITFAFSPLQLGQSLELKIQ